jgi:hypothetical protein
MKGHEWSQVKRESKKGHGSKIDRAAGTKCASKVAGCLTAIAPVVLLRAAFAESDLQAGGLSRGKGFC